MTSLDADALQTDPEGLALLRDVLGTATSGPPAMRPTPLPSPEPVKPAMPLARTTRRLGLVGSAARVGRVIAASPAKPPGPREPGARPTTTEMRQDGTGQDGIRQDQMRPETPRETPAPSRPVRTVTKYAAAEAEPPACPRVRRKLWVEGEGWIVRTVSRC